MTKQPSDLHKTPKFKSNGQVLTELSPNENGSTLGNWEQDRDYSNWPLQMQVSIPILVSNPITILVLDLSANKVFKTVKSFVLSIRYYT